MQKSVTRNYAEKSINNILDYVGGEGKVIYQGFVCRVELMKQHAAKAPSVSLDTLEEFYSATKEACDEAKNEVRAVLHVAKNGPHDQRLSNKSSTKLAKLLLDRKEYSRLQPVILRILDVLSFRFSPHCMRLVHLGLRLAHPKIRPKGHCVGRKTANEPR